MTNTHASKIAHFEEMKEKKLQNEITRNDNVIQALMAKREALDKRIKDEFQMSLNKRKLIAAEYDAKIEAEKNALARGLLFCKKMTE